MDTKKLRQKILDLAIRGKLVPQDQNDEPASVLLERIREEKKQMVKEGKLKAKDIKNDTIIFKGEDNLHYEKFQDGTVKCIEDEIPFEIPAGWEWCRLRNITEFIRNGATIKQYQDAGGYPITRIETISFETVDRKKLGYGNINDLENYRSYILQDQDILLSHINSPKHLGKTALYEKKEGESIIHGMNLLCIRMIDREISKYILISLKTSEFKTHVWSKMKQAVNQASITTVSIGDYVVPIPPHNELHAIIDRVDNYSSYIDSISVSNEDLKTIIDQTKAKILDLAIRGELIPQNPDDEPASVLLERIRTEKEAMIKQGKLKRDKKESIIYKGDDNSYYQTGSSEPIDVPYEIPETWVWSNLKELCNYGVCDNISPETINSDAWILDLEDIEKDTGKVLYRATNAERKTTSTKHSFRKGMILYSKLRPYLNKVVLADEDGYCTSEIIPLQFSEIILPRYAQLFLMSPFFVGYANHCSYGMKMPRLGTHDGEKALFAIPPYQEQSRIVDMVDKLHANIDIILESLTM